MPIDYILPIKFYRVGNTSFTDRQVEEMVARTNRKLTNVGIKIEIESISHINSISKAYISLKSKQNELKELLLQYGYQGATKDKFLRVFLVKLDIDEYLGSWSYDPDPNPEYQAAIFITELFNDNSDEAYEAQLYRKENDSLLHELGHTLMWESSHIGGVAANFFHELAELTDDSITPQQSLRLRGEDPGRPADAPNYLRSVLT
ncbi:MAG: hypothetical protein DBO99_06110 [gamma proteobacterium symbiont of Ctena orbiculata]|nr:MAG: hypothetical protein DBO99_06110 [gamma proteobacterium symbiont of Ctena orbiculata]